MEAPVTIWYLYYVIDKFNENIIIGSAQLCVYVILFIIGNSFMSYIGKKMQSLKESDNIGINSRNETSTYVNSSERITFFNANNDRYNCFHYLIIVGYIVYIVLFILTLIIFPIIENGNLFWIFLPLYGVMRGIGFISLAMLLVEIQPKHMIGKIWGIRSSLRCLIKGLLCLICGICWNISKEWIWYPQAILSAISIVLIAIFSLLS